MKNTPIITQIEGRAACITLNRPGVLNAINLEMMQSLENAVLTLSGRNDLSVLVLRGAGRGFCAGADLKLMLSILHKPRELAHFIDRINRAFNCLEDFPLPVVAVVQDYALAGGFELIQACDIVIAAETARLGDQHAGFWMIPGGGGTQRLPFIVGPHRAKDLLFSGRWLTGKEAERVGLVSRAVPPEDIEQAVAALVHDLSRKSPVTLGKMKQLVQHPFRQTIREGLKYEQEVFLEYMQTPSALEGLKAFMEKRKPDVAAIEI